MRDSDLGAFTALLDGVWALKGQSLPAAAKAMWFRALGAYPLEAVRAALDAHLGDPDRGRFLPMPADVLAQLAGFDGRPGAEEAWSIAVRAGDEADTVVWTAETAEAFGIARPVLAAGDEVGARMAFREAYERLVTASRREHRAAAWRVSEGFDPERRDRVIAESVARGLLSSSDYPALPAPRSAAPLLLESAIEHGIPESARAALLTLRQWLTSKPEETESADIASKRETAARAKEATRRVADLMGAGVLTREPVRPFTEPVERDEQEF